MLPRYCATSSRVSQPFRRGSQIAIQVPRSRLCQTSAPCHHPRRHKKVISIKHNYRESQIAVLPLTFIRLSSRMSSDADYEAFLNKANEDVSGTKTQSKSKTIGIKAINTEVPKALEKVDEVFVSDADEPFEPVSLTYQGDKLPSTGKFSRTPP